MRENGVYLEECMRGGGVQSCDCVVIIGDVFVLLVSRLDKLLHFSQACMSISYNVDGFIRSHYRYWASCE